MVFILAHVHNQNNEYVGEELFQGNDIILTKWKTEYYLTSWFSWIQTIKCCGFRERKSILEVGTMSSAWQNPISFLCISKNTGFSQSDGKSPIFVPWLVIVSIQKHLFKDWCEKLEIHVL